MKILIDKKEYAKRENISLQTAYSRFKKFETIIYNKVEFAVENYTPSTPIIIENEVEKVVEKIVYKENTENLIRIQNLEEENEHVRDITLKLTFVSLFLFVALIVSIIFFIIK